MSNWIKYVITLIVVVGIAGAGYYYTTVKDQEVVKQSRSLGDLVKKVAKVDRSKVLMVGNSNIYPPYTFRDGSAQMAGFDVELGIELGKRMNREVVFYNMNWADKDDLLNNGDIDVIWSGYPVTDERRKKYTHSDNYISDTITLIVNESSSIANTDDLAGLIVGHQAGSVSRDIVNNFKTSTGLTVKQGIGFPSIPEALSALVQGDIDVYMGRRGIVKYYDNNSPNVFRVLENITFAKLDMAIAAKKGNNALVKEMNVALGDIKKTDFYEKLNVKWFGKKTK